MSSAAKIQCIIVDDEPAAHYVLANYIKQNQELELVFEAYNGLEALQYLESHNPQLMFLDIDMPGLSGMELLKKLNNPPRTVLTTAYSEFALESYDYGVMDYLLKPIYYPRFVKSLKRFFELTTQHEVVDDTPATGGISVKVDSDIIEIELEQVLYAQSFGNYVKIFTPRRYYLATITTNELERLLPSAHFMRAHKSYIVALDKVDEVHKDHLVIRRTEVPIGITYRRELIERLK
ncbi:LytR/AlgR family response regulator transcription factor [Flavobacterium sp. RHBU_24]|uniref:LytR/AlgR family response regulator transcription factor n=1 Tax=Flavobacterium sp. RHBU_24 TaxID=3391185 RepID=UPI0039846514